MNSKYIKNYLLNKIGKKVVVIYNGSRNRREKYSGILYKVYNNVFILKLSDNSIKCFNFCDIFTKSVQLYI